MSSSTRRRAWTPAGPDSTGTECGEPPPCALAPRVLPGSGTASLMQTPRPPQSHPTGAQFPFADAQEPAAALAVLPGAAGAVPGPPAAAPFSAGTSPVLPA